MAKDEGVKATLPRSPKMDGRDLLIVGVEEDVRVVISDGERTAPYEPMKGKVPILSPARRIASR